MEDYIHGGEFVVLTNRSVTDDKEKLSRKQAAGALKIAEGCGAEDSVFFYKD